MLHTKTKLRFIVSTCMTIEHPGFELQSFFGDTEKIHKPRKNKNQWAMSSRVMSIL